MTPQIILGGPGAGKTTRLLDILESELERGVPSDRIAFVSFTKQATREATRRARERFDLEDRDLPHFRTVHSLAYRELGLDNRTVMGDPDYRAISRSLGMRFGGYFDAAAGPATDLSGDALSHVCGYARSCRISLADAWHAVGPDLDWHTLKLFDDTLEAYKRASDKRDYADMLALYPERCAPLHLEVAIVDEAQDLSAAQWAVVDHAFSGADRLYVAGDDDQAIYGWSGADVARFLDMAGDVELLPISHRLPESVFALADRTVRAIRHRREKRWRSNGERGLVERIVDPGSVDLSEGTWMLLARNRYLTEQFEAEATDQAVVYRTSTRCSVDLEHVRAILTWERLRKGEGAGNEDLQALAKCLPGLVVSEAPGLRRFEDLGIAPDQPIWHDALEGIDLLTREYYLSILRRGRRLQDPPKVYIGTIHSVKGGEADNVLLRTDMAYRTHRGYEQSPDEEHRVFYVGMTRARHNLFLMEPQTTRAYHV